MWCAYGSCEQKKITHLGLYLKTLLILLCFFLLEGFYHLNGEEMVQVYICQVHVGLEIRKKLKDLVCLFYVRL